MTLLDDLQELEDPIESPPKARYARASLAAYVPQGTVLLWAGKGKLRKNFLLLLLYYPFCAFMALDIAHDLWPVVEGDFSFNGKELLFLLFYSILSVFVYGAAVLMLFWELPKLLFNPTSYYGASATHFYIKKPNEALETHAWEKVIRVEGEEEDGYITRLKAIEHFYHGETLVFEANDLHTLEGGLTRLQEIHQNALDHATR